ncbi:MAG TPA: flagellar biosynthetic protein FliR [Nitrospirota bacterium]|nr:flagellar biosynthetic protein FliR [Nitrospirota bacterium]
MEDVNKLIPNFLIILLRASIVLNMLPFLGSTSFPAQFRIGTAVAVALVLTPVLEFQAPKASIAAVAGREVLFGMIFGFAARFVFYAVDTAGQVISNATGMSMATIINPEIGQSTEISQLLSIIATLVFFAVDAHHELILLFVKSFEWVPAGTASVSGVMSACVPLATQLFILAIKLSAPVLIIMLSTNILLGFVSKAAPQMNVFFVGYPVYLFLGLFTMLVCLPAYTYVLGRYFQGIPEELGRVMVLMQR